MARLTGASRSIHCSSPPVFLAPLLAADYVLAQNRSKFSTSAPLCKRKSTHKRDSNPDRGVSALRRTGLRHPVSMAKVPLPQPVLDPSKRKIEVDKNHGLWGFFNTQRTVLSTPDEDAAFGLTVSFYRSTTKKLTIAVAGRPWVVEELRHKSWEDLHALWWICCRERNRISTQNKEREKMKAGYGEYEAAKREKAVRCTPRLRSSSPHFAESLYC